MSGNKSTSWDKVADWYDKSLKTGSYQEELIIPNLKRILKEIASPGDKILDLGCGQGILAADLSKKGYRVVGIDLANSLIDIAKQRNPEVEFMVEDATNFSKEFIEKYGQTFDVVVSILALQNIAELEKVMLEVAKALKTNGKFVFVVNHPGFRIPKNSSWGWDMENKVQYRRIDKYYSNSKTGIATHPGKNDQSFTWSFHRPLEFYVKTLKAAGFVVSDLEEWVSHKVSEPGSRAEMENKARKEFPLFMAITAELK